jgi:hypothetical protein
MSRVDAHPTGPRRAESALDMALWDLTGGAAGLRTYALPGGSDALPRDHLHRPRRDGPHGPHGPRGAGDRHPPVPG